VNQNDDGPEDFKLEERAKILGKALEYLGLKIFEDK
jgi:hypothetical protein